MNKTNFFFLLFSLVFFVSAMAQEDKKDEVPPGMEIIQIGPGHRAIVPKGSKVRKKSGLVIIETTDEYVSRKFLEIEKRFAKIEAREEELKSEIEHLKKVLIEQLKTVLDEIQKSALPSEKRKE